MTATFAYRLLHEDGRSLMLFLHTGETPDDDTWNRSMAELQQHIASLGGNTSTLAFLVVTDGGAPNVVQRASLTAATSSKQFPLAVVSDSTLIRGAVTTIGWVNPGIKAFHPSRWDDAVQHAGLNAASGRAVRLEMQALQQQLGTTIRCLDAVVRLAA